MTIPRVDQRQWEAIGSWLAEGLDWLTGLWSNQSDPPLPILKEEPVTASELSRTLRRSARAREALRTLAEETEKFRKSRTIQRKKRKI